MFPSFVVIGFTVVQNNIFVLLLSLSSISAGFSLVDCSPCILIYRCPIVVFLHFSICLLINVSVSSGQVFRKPFFIALSTIDVVGLKRFAFRYCAISGLDVCDIMLFVTASDCCVSRGNSHFPVIFLVPLIISCPFL